MKIKNYECKCGCDDFFFMNKGVQVGIYCTLCGKWYKWADKDEQNLKNKIPEKTEEDIVNDYCKSRCMTLITDDALEEFLKTNNSKLSDKQKLAIKAMMFVFDKWSERYVGSTYIDNRHNVTDDNSIDFGEAYNICSKLIKGEE